MKTQIFVMPAWIAGIHVRKDASGNIHVNLDSSTPCWNDAIGGLLELTEVLHLLFSKEAKLICLEF
jgi:hypothetical protein